MQEGLTPEIIDRLSKEKGDPVWMQQFRLQSLQIYNEMPVPDWGPSIEGLDMDHIAKRNYQQRRQGGKHLYIQFCGIWKNGSKLSQNR